MLENETKRYEIRTARLPLSLTLAGGPERLFWQEQRDRAGHLTYATRTEFLGDAKLRNVLAVHPGDD
jgi:hypothetical protein